MEAFRFGPNTEGKQLLFVIENNSLSALRELLFRGNYKNQINFQDPDTGKTPLIAAASSHNMNNIAMVRRLLEYGADPTKQDHDGNFPTDYAKKLTSAKEVFHIMRWKVKEELNKAIETAAKSCGVMDRSGMTYLVHSHSC